MIRNNCSASPFRLRGNFFFQHTFSEQSSKKTFIWRVVEPGAISASRKTLTSGYRCNRSGKTQMCILWFYLRLSLALQTCSSCITWWRWVYLTWTNESSPSINVYSFHFETSDAGNLNASVCSIHTGFEYHDHSQSVAGYPYTGHFFLFKR